MISLRDLLYEDDDGRTKEYTDTRSVWRTPLGNYGAQNTTGQIRYFKDREDATKFARGEIKGPHMGRPKVKQRPKNKEEKETYDDKD